MFVFFGHADTHKLDFYNDYQVEWKKHSYIVDFHPNAPLGTWYTYLEGTYYDLNYMVFAYLGGCSTASGSGGNITNYMRCYKGVDEVLGFDEDPVCPPLHEYTEQFFKNAILGHKSISYSASRARDIVRQQFCSYFNTETYEIWGRTQGRVYIDTPRWGV